MYAVTSRPLLSRTRAILRSAELGFFGVIVLTCRHTPRFCGLASRSLTLLIRARLRRGFLINWLIVGIVPRFAYAELQPVDRRKASRFQMKAGKYMETITARQGRALNSIRAHFPTFSSDRLVPNPPYRA